MREDRNGTEPPPHRRQTGRIGGKDCKGNVGLLGQLQRALTRPGRVEPMGRTWGAMVVGRRRDTQSQALKFPEEITEAEMTGKMKGSKQKQEN